jgi:hypothetical protein
MRYPAVFGAYAVIIAAFGDTHTAIHWGLLILNGLTAVFLFLSGRRLAGDAVGLASAAFFATLSLGVFTEGFSANSEHFVILFASAGLWLLLRGAELRERLTLAAAGACFAMAFLMKQHGVAFLLFGGLFLCGSEWGRRPRERNASVGRVGFFVGGAALVFLSAVAHIAVTGRLYDFYYWTWGYASQYASATPLGEGMRVLATQLPHVVMPMVFIWALAAAGLFSALKRKENYLFGFLAGLLLLSFLATSIGFYYRPHYFRLLFPAVALLGGVGACALAKGFASGRRGIAAGILIVVFAAGYSLIHERAILFQSTPAEASRAISGGNPFLESLVVAEYLADHTEPGDPIAVLGSEPQIYFYTQRPAATGHIYTYQLMEDHPFALDMQEQLIEEIERGKPKFVVWVNIPTSWLIRDTSDLHVIEWGEAFLRDRYQQVGLVDIISPTRTDVHWDEAARGAMSISPSGFFLTIHRRNENS